MKNNIKKVISEMYIPGIAKALIKMSKVGEEFVIEPIEFVTPIEVVNMKPTSEKKFEGTYETSGMLSEVTKESVQLALTVARSYMRKKDPTNTFLDNAHLHIHIPPGHYVKYGSCAGLSICTALISLANGQAIKKNMVMTGELSLNGKIIGVNCLKDKIVAAYLEKGIKHLILPKGNEAEFNKLNFSFMKENINLYFVSTYDDVYNICFKSTPI